MGLSLLNEWSTVGKGLDLCRHDTAVSVFCGEQQYSHVSFGFWIPLSHVTGLIADAVLVWLHFAFTEKQPLGHLCQLGLTHPWMHQYCTYMIVYWHLWTLMFCILISLIYTWTLVIVKPSIFKRSNVWWVQTNGCCNQNKRELEQTDRHIMNSLTVWVELVT